jgi:hypothetical protein
MPNALVAADNAERARREAVLHVCACRLGHPAVVRGGLDTRGLQHGGGRLRPRARRRVDQRPTISHEGPQQLLLLGLTRHGTDPRVDVGPIEAGHDDVRLAEAEELDDVVADFQRGRGSQCGHWRTS